jgi:hypothetical protein
VGQRAQAVDARVRPEVEEHDAPAQRRERDRAAARRVEPGADALERRRRARVGEGDGRVLGRAGQPVGARIAAADVRESRPDRPGALEGLEAVRVARGVPQGPGCEPGVQAEQDEDARRHHEDAHALAHPLGPRAQAARQPATPQPEQEQRHGGADRVREEDHDGRAPRVARRHGRRHRRQDRARARSPDEPQRHADPEAPEDALAAAREAVADAAQRAERPGDAGVRPRQEERRADRQEHERRGVALDRGAEPHRVERRRQRQREEHERAHQPEHDADGAPPPSPERPAQHDREDRQDAGRHRRRGPGDQGEEGQDQHRTATLSAGAYGIVKTPPTSRSRPGEAPPARRAVAPPTRRWWRCARPSRPPGPPRRGAP